MAYKYFLYSSTQLRDRIAIEKKAGRTFVPGTVSVGPKLKKYTEVSSKNSNRYSDTVIVAEGDISKMTYTPIKSTK
jgi:hypothetical protein